jgi:hypothetical protein
MTLENNKHEHNGEQDLNFDFICLVKFEKKKVVHKR